MMVLNPSELIHFSAVAVFVGLAITLVAIRFASIYRGAVTGRSRCDRRIGGRRQAVAFAIAGSGWKIALPVFGREGIESAEIEQMGAQALGISVERRSPRRGSMQGEPIWLTHSTRTARLFVRM